MRPEAEARGPEGSDDLRDGFALRLVAVLGALGVRTTYDAEAFALRMDGGGISWLGNRFEEWVRTPGVEQEGLLLQIAHAIYEASAPSPVSSSVEEARPHLRPRIRQRAHLVIVGLQMEADGVAPGALSLTFVPVTTDLGAEVVFDTPTNIVSVPTDRLAAWGLEPDEALAIAVDNLRATAPAPFVDAGDGLFLAKVGDCYDSARLLMVDEIAALPLAGDPVALPANRDLLAITGSDDIGGLYRLLQLALEALDRPRLDTLQPVVLRGGRWQDWLPDEGHPMREAFYELAVRTRGTSYAELKDLVEARHQRDAVDLFVASFGMMQLSDVAAPFSHALWPPVRGWLPESDLVSVVHPDERRYAVVPRPHLLAVASHLLEVVPGLHPPYHAFEGVPDEATWDALAAGAAMVGEIGRPR